MNTVAKVEQKYLKKSPELRSGDTVRVHQKIREGAKERVQIFEGVVLRVKGGGVKKSFLVRKISFGVGVEKNFLIHSPNIAKIEIKKRAKVRQAYLTYLRNLRGKKARLKDMQFDALAVNVKDEPEEEFEELPIEKLSEGIEEVSLDEVIKEENKEAAAEDMDESGQTEEGPAGSDDQANEIAEIEQGLEKAEADAEKGKTTEGERAEEVQEDTTAEEIAEEIKEEKEAE